MDVILFSTQYFEESTWTNKQHIAVRLAAMGHRVIYVDPGSRVSPRKYSLPGQLARAVRGELPAKCFFGFSYEVRENLWVVTPPTQIPRRLRFIRRLNERITTRGNLRRIRGLARRLGFKHPVLWIYRPEAVWFAGRLGEAVVFYDCVDDYVEYPVYPFPEENERIRRDEAELLARADLVTTTSHYLYEQKSPANPNTHYVPNVADAAHFARAADADILIPVDVARLPQPRIGFAGAVHNYKLDTGLLTAVSDERPDWQIILIGPAAVGDPGIDGLVARPNVHLLGPRPYDDLPAYLAAMDVMVIPYRLNEYTRSCFPIKFFEYLATGKPTVCTSLPALADFGGVLPLVSDRAGFIAALEDALAGGQDGLRQARVELAFENTWEKRIATLLELVSDSFS